MTIYRTCRNCAVDPQGCVRRDKLRAGIAGLGITSVKFSCPDRQPTFRVGQRVSVTWAVPCDDENPYQETWPATVIKESGARFLIHVDDVDSDEGTPASSWLKNESRMARPSPEALRAIEEPDRPICTVCLSDGSLCHEQYNPSYFPEKCIKRPA